MAERLVSPRRAIKWTWQDGVVLALTCAVALYRFSYTVADPDLWGHVKFGELFLQSGIVREDPYSYLTAGVPWTDHEWLSEALFYLAFVAGGPRGLVLGKLAVTLFIVATTYIHLRRRDASAHQAGAVVLLVIIAMIPGMTTVRTQVFTYLLFFVLLLVLTSPAPLWLWACPVLFLVWANLHPGFIAGLAILAVWCAVKLGGTLTRRLRHDEGAIALNAGAISVASFLATAVTPFGIELWRFLLHPRTFDRPDISEWQAVTVANPYGLAYVAILGVSITGILLSRRHRDPALMAVFAGVALAPLTASRHGALFGLAVGVLAGEHIADAWSRLRPLAASSVGRHRDRWVVSGAALVVVVVSLVGTARQLSCIRIEPATGAYYPVHAIALLRDSAVSGNLAVHFDWGLYAIWHLQPTIKVSVDGRRETAYSSAVYNENLRFWSGIGEWDTLVRRPMTDMALVSKEFPVYNLMKLKTGWVLAHEDAGSGLFVRAGSPPLKALQRTPLRPLPPGGAGLCFP